MVKSKAMSIEGEIFKNHRVLLEKLEAFGFAKESMEGKDVFRFERKLPGCGMKAFVEYDGSFYGKIVDTDMEEEYTNFRRPGASGFSAEVRGEFEALLLEIRGKCCENLFFQSEQGRRICGRIVEEYGTKPEFLWKNLPTYAVFRKAVSGKWFSIVGTVQRSKVDKESSSSEIVEIVNVKVCKERLDEILSTRGVFPAYHMNKKSWVSIIFDGTVPDETILSMLHDSFDSV